MDNIKLIAQVLDSFKIGYTDMQVTEGTTVSLYEFKPKAGTRLSKIRNLKDEFAIALEAKSVRIIAPIPGRGTVGIEVPHKVKQILGLKEILNSQEFLTTEATLPLAIGKTITGKTFITDLADAPHLLVAGATGQGKSVGLNVMLMSLLHKKTPDELKLVLIDPKRVELSLYEKLNGSYLAEPVVTEEAKASKVLHKLCSVMDQRYVVVSAAGKRNIKEYNEVADKPMPYIVVVIDEYGDLIMQSGKSIERAICRLAQKARAVGIHLIISTQRPSATIVTGNIKANFPTRIAFRCTTGTDSRVVLDQVGAEKLTGNGDMLFFAGAETTRMQCAYTSIEDVAATCDEIAGSYSDYENVSVVPERKKVKTTYPVHEFMLHWAIEMSRYSEFAEYDIPETDALDKMKVVLQELGVWELETDQYGRKKFIVKVHDKEELDDIIMPYVVPYIPS